MRIFQILVLRLRTLFKRTEVEGELDEELRYHLDRQIEEFVAEGMSPEQARQAAWRTMGGLEQRKEECRDMRGWNAFEHLSGDIRFALRQLRQNPGFAGTAILILALGLCASLSIFAFVDAALLKPLPYRDPARMMAVFGSQEMFPRNNLSYPDYLDWKRLNTTLESLEIYRRTGSLLATAEGVQPVRGVRVSDGFFRTLGVKPTMGRDFQPGEDLAGSPRTVLLSYAAWQSRYGGRAGIVGQTVTLDQQPNVIVGVLPREFHFAPAGMPEFWAAYHPEAGCDARRGCRSLYGVGRLKDGVSQSSALSNLTAIAKELERQYPGSNRGQAAAIASLGEVIVGDVRPILLVLLAGAGLLLAIASINVISLLLVRSESRRREIAVRTALGASAGRLWTQFLTEAVVLTGAGTLLGLAGAHWTMKVLVGLISEEMMQRMPFLLDLGLSERVLAFGGLLSLLVAVLCAMTPSLRLGSPDVRGGLAEGSRGAAGIVWRRLGAKLVVLELATAMVLLVSAGLLGKSLYRLLNVEVGLKPERLVTMDVMTQAQGYEKPEARIALARRIAREMEELPGVTSVGFTGNGAPLGGNGNTTWLRVLGRPWNGEHNETPERDVSPTYFATVGAKLARGRYFREDEDGTKPAVAIVNQAFARQHFAGEEVLGRHVSYLSTPPVPIEIVGVVEDIREGPLDAAIPPVLYIPFYQSPDRFFSLMVRTSQSEAALLPAMAAKIRQAGVVSMGGMTMSERLEQTPSAVLHRTSAWLVGGFAAAALVLGLVGLYGVVAYSVSQRTREIGVRMALGARPSAVYRLILGEAGWLTGFGLLLGLVASVGAATLIQGLLFGVSSWDLPTLGMVAVGLGFAALLASFVPARRAAAINPVDALRAE